MEDVKSWWQSRTIWGSIVGVAATIVSLVFHKTVSAADQSAIVDVILTLIGSAGALYAIYGRIVATTQIGTVK
jgi:hypothetical protein